MKRPIVFLLLIFIASACAKDNRLNNTLKAMEKDYSSGKMDRETYLNRTEAIKNSAEWKDYSQEKQQEQKRQLERERFYREFQSFYVNPQEKEGPATSCFRNLDGGVTCRKKE